MIRGPGTLYADEDRILQWFAHAGSHGHWVRFAVGAAREPGHPVEAHIRAWEKSGVLEIRTDPLADGSSAFSARKVSFDPSTGSGLRTSGERPPETVKLELADRCLLDLLQQLASMGKHELPSYAKLAEGAGLRNRWAARHAFGKLSRAGLVPAVFVKVEGVAA